MRPILAFSLVLLLRSAICAADFTYTISLSASPQSIVADGKSATTVRAEVRDPAGNLVPDGTLINFSTNAGAVDAAVQTQAGIARAKLRSASAPATALVSAALAAGGAVAQVQVEFVPLGSEFQQETFITLTSTGYLVYYTAEQIAEALDGIRIIHRGLTIQAASAQVDLAAGVVRARGRTGGDPVTVTRGEKAIRASQLYYRLADMEGQLVTSTDGKVERLALHGRDLSTEPLGVSGKDVSETSSRNTDQDADLSGASSRNTVQDSRLFDFATLEGGGVVVMARAMTIKPGEEVQFRRARVFVEGSKVLSLPLHVLPLRPGSGSRSLFSLTSTGVRLNIPLYYSVTPSSIGALLVRHQQKAGWGYYGGQPGWSLGLEQEYSSGQDLRGAIGVDRIVGGDWGAHWTHEQQLGQSTRFFTYIDYPDHRDLFGSVSLSRSFQKSTLGMSLYGSQVKGSRDSYSSDVYLQSKPKPLLGKYANYVIGARTTYSTFGAPNRSRVGFGLQGQLLGRTLPLTPSADFTSYVTVGRDWGGRAEGLTTCATAGLAQRLSPASTASLTYNFSRDPGISTLGHHSLSATAFLAGSSPWSGSLYSTMGLDSSLFSGFGEMFYQINPGLRLGVIGTYQEFSGSEFGDIELALGKRLWNQEFRLIYSLDKSAFRLEMAGFSF